MVISAFPDVELADENGLLALGGDTEVESLLLAYRSGIFPWPLSPEYLTWFSPPERALLFTEQAHISKSLQKAARKHAYTITANLHFEEVIMRCSELLNRGDQPGTWITDEIIQGYCQLFKAGYAYSVECSLDGELVGGLYGVTIGKMYSGESMFYRKPNASKLCLFFLIEKLRAHNIPWLDCQVKTPLLSQFGVQEVPRQNFLSLLKSQVNKPATNIFT